MIRRTTWLVAALLMTSCSGGGDGRGPAGPGPGPGPGPDLPGEPFDPDEVLVRLAPGVEIETIHQRYGTRTRDVVEPQRVYLLELEDDDEAGEILVAMRQDPDLSAAAPNARTGIPEAQGRSTMAFADPSLTESQFRDQAAFSRIRAPEAAREARGDAGVLVAVLDTGVDAGHPSLAGRVVPGIDLVDDDPFPDDLPNGLDDDGDGLVDEAVGHGTFIAGLVLSVAPDAVILPIRVLDSDGAGTAIDVARGIEEARRRGARIVNMSFGMTVEADVIGDLVDELADDAGIVFVASAGNETSDRPRFPADEDEVLAVAATDPADRRAGFSNFGSWVEIAAPGVGLVSLLPGGALGSWSGTSFAAALVSGGSALLVSLRPDAGSDDVRRALEDTAVRIPGLGGAGRVDLLAAVRELLTDSANGDGDGA